MNALKNKLIVLLFLLFTSCSGRYGYGVVLWSANEIELASGMIVRIVGESQRRGIFRVHHPDTKSVVEIDTWRLVTFKNKSQAQAYLSEYAPFLKTYVEVRRSALPMREFAYVSASSVYSLRDGQVLKVLGRTKEREQIGGYKAYWYQLLASDGTIGWTYGRFLREFVLTESGQAVYDEKDYTGDAILENFFNSSNIWRPAYIYNMVESEMVNLMLVKEEYGLFINPESKTISIRLPSQNVDFTYTRVTPVGGNAYMFVDSPFSFTLKDNLVQARYSINGRNHRSEFKTINKSLKEIITEEELRRTVKYHEFMKVGPTFRGDLGTLVFTGEGSFILSDNKKLNNLQVLLPSDGQEGSVLFDVFLSSDLKDYFDGAFSLLFSDSGKRITFAYRMGTGGFHVTWVERLTSEKIILKQNLSSIETIFVS